METLPESLKKFIAFKFNQHLNVNGLVMTNEEKTYFLQDQIINQTELLKSWISEAIASNAV